MCGEGGDVEQHCPRVKSHGTTVQMERDAARGSEKMLLTRGQRWELTDGWCEWRM